MRNYMDTLFPEALWGAWVGNHPGLPGKLVRDVGRIDPRWPDHLTDGGRGGAAFRCLGVRGQEARLRSRPPAGPSLLPDDV